MPYISKVRSKEISIDALKEIADKIKQPGELNYIITTLMVLYLKNIGTNYTNLSMVAAQGHNASYEFYRRLTAEYEDMKRLHEDNIDPYKLLLQ